MEFIAKKVMINNEPFVIALGENGESAKIPYDHKKYLKKQFEAVKVKYLKKYKLPLSGWMSWAPDNKCERIYINRHLSQRKLHLKPYAGFIKHNGGANENNN